MSSIVDRIITTQQDVADFEEGKPLTHPSGEPRGILKEYIESSLADLASEMELPEFAAIVYQYFRRIEAVVYRFKGADRQASVKQHVEWAREAGPLIQARLADLEKLHPDSDLEELGKFFVEEKLRWALGRINAFADWGY